MTGLAEPLYSSFRDRHVTPAEDKKASLTSTLNALEGIYQRPNALCHFD